MRGLYWCVLFIAFSLTSPLNPLSKMDVRTRFIASTAKINAISPLHAGEGHGISRPDILPPLHAMGRGSGGGDTTLIYIHTPTQTITAYDPQTDTHTPIFTCPEACYDPSTDQNGQIGFVTTNGFGIFDPISGDYTQFLADFGVYGYKGGATFRSDLALVAYEGRFNMQMRLLLTDLSTGETTDLYGAGVGNPSWMRDDEAVIISDGATIWHVPINGDDVTALDIPRPAAYADLVMPFGNDWLYRAINETGYTIFISTDDTHTALIEAPAIVTYALSDTHIASANFDPRSGNYTVSIVDTSAITSSISISNRREIVDIALAPDNQYVAWLEENADMGFGFYDLWIADLSVPNITPIRIAEHISDPSTRPSGLTWIDTNP